MSEPPATPAGSAAQPGRPVTFSAMPPAQPSSLTFPERWPRPKKRSATVSRIAARVAPTTWATSAPPAGLLAAVAAAIWVSICAWSLGRLRSCYPYLTVTNAYVTPTGVTVLAAPLGLAAQTLQLAAEGLL